MYPVVGFGNFLCYNRIPSGLLDKLLVSDAKKQDNSDRSLVFGHIKIIGGLHNVKCRKETRDYQRIRKN